MAARLRLRLSDQSPFRPAFATTYLSPDDVLLYDIIHHVYYGCYGGAGKFPFSEKALTSMRAVVALAENVPLVNTQEAMAAQTAQRVRARFRAVTSMIGLPVVFDSKGLVSLLIFHLPTAVTCRFLYILYSVCPSEQVKSDERMFSWLILVSVNVYLSCALISATSYLYVCLVCSRFRRLFCCCARRRLRTSLSELRYRHLIAARTRGRDGPCVSTIGAGTLLFYVVDF